MAENNVHFVEYCKTCRTLVHTKNFNEERMECRDCHAARTDSYEDCGCSHCLAELTIEGWKFRSPEGSGRLV